MSPKKKSNQKKTATLTDHLRSLSHHNAAFMACFIAVASFRFADDETMGATDRGGPDVDSHQTVKHADPSVLTSERRTEERKPAKTEMVPPKTVLPPFQWAVASCLMFLSFAGRRFTKPLPTIPPTCDDEEKPFLIVGGEECPVPSLHLPSRRPRVLALVPLANGRIAVRADQYDCAIMVFDVFGPGRINHQPHLEFCMPFGYATGLAAMPDKLRLLAADRENLAIINPEKKAEKAVERRVFQLLFVPGAITVCDDNRTVVIEAPGSQEFSVAVADLPSGKVIKLLHADLFWRSRFLGMAPMPGGCVHVQSVDESYVLSELRGTVKRTTLTSTVMHRKAPHSNEWSPLRAYPTGEGKTQALFAIVRKANAEDSSQRFRIVALKATDPSAPWEVVADFPTSKRTLELARWSLTRLLDGRMMLYSDTGYFHVLE